MARSRAIEAPARNDVYFGMWAFTFGAIVVAVSLLCLELTDYGWTSTPPAATAPNLPNVPARVAPSPAANAMAEPAPAAPAPKAPEPANVAEAPKSEPATVEPLKLPPARIPPSVTTATKLPETVPTRPANDPVKPAPPAGPVPGFELPRRR